MNNTEKMTVLYGVFALGMVMIFMMIVGMESEREVEKDSVEDYCSMVELWEKTNGELGWPPRASLSC